MDSLLHEQSPLGSAIEPDPNAILLRPLNPDVEELFMELSVFVYFDWACKQRSHDNLFVGSCVNLMSRLYTFIIQQRHIGQRVPYSSLCGHEPYKNPSVRSLQTLLPPGKVTPYGRSG